MIHARLKRSAFRPLKITAALQCGVLGDIALPFDALLYYAVHREQYGRQYLTIPGEATNGAPTAADTSLPLARVEEHGPQWYYAASWADWGERYADGGDHWSKRLALGRLKYLDQARGSVDVASGRYKSYRMPVFYRHALSISWHCLGEPERIRRLLAHMAHIGKKTSQGWGAVNEWRVEECQADYSVRRADGTPARAIPAKGGTLIGYRPSYWLSGNQAPCQVPNGGE